MRLCDHNCVILQMNEQGALCLIYSMKKEFLDRVVVEKMVYKLDEKSTTSV